MNDDQIVANEFVNQSADRPKSIPQLERLLDQYPRLTEDVVHDLLVVAGQQLHLGVAPAVLIMRLRQPSFAVIRGSIEETTGR